MNKRVVVALGGNALGNNLREQMVAVRDTARALVDLVEQGYDVVPKESKGTPISSFDEDDLDYLAEREHNAWYKLRINSGWKYGEVKDENLLTNPNLVQWEDLNDSTKI